MSRVFGEIRQVGYVVDDIEAAMRFFSAKAGIGPWFYAGEVTLKDALYRGRPQTIELSIALANSGSLQLELIQQRNDAPSIYREWRRRHPQGRLMQHYSSWSDRYGDVVAEAARKGFETVLEGRSKYGPFAYFGHPDDPEFLFEVTEFTAERRYMFETIAAAAVGWDGSDPIRWSWPNPDDR